MPNLRPNSLPIAPGGGPKVLVVVLHGLFADPHQMEDIRRAAVEAYGPRTVVRVPEMPYARTPDVRRA